MLNFFPRVNIKIVQFIIISVETVPLDMDKFKSKTAL